MKKKTIAAFLAMMIALTVVATVSPVAADYGYNGYNGHRPVTTGAVPVYLWIGGTRTPQPVAWAGVAPYGNTGNFVVTKVIPVDGARGLATGTKLNLFIQVGRSKFSPAAPLARLVVVHGRILLVLPKVLFVPAPTALAVLAKQATLVVTVAPR